MLATNFYFGNRDMRSWLKEFASGQSGFTTLAHGPVGAHEAHDSVKQGRRTSIER